MSIQTNMFDFDGATYRRDIDRRPLNDQLRKVFEFMRCGRWRTLYEISTALNISTQSVSARLRDFRKPRFGGHTVNRRHRGNETLRLYEYQLVENKGGK